MPDVTFSEFRSHLLNNTNYSPDEIYNVWKSVFQNEQHIEPTKDRVNVVYELALTFSYDDLMVSLKRR